MLTERQRLLKCRAGGIGTLREPQPSPFHAHVSLSPNCEMIQRVDVEHCSGLHDLLRRTDLVWPRA